LTPEQRFLDRLHVESDHWVDIVDEMPRTLQAAAGSSDRLRQEAKPTDRQSVQGVGFSPEHFG